MRHTRTGPAGGLLEGWRLVGVVGAVLVTAVVVLALAAGGGIDGVRLAIRTTARTSIALFLLAFTASSLAALVPTPLTAWQLRNRRYLGVSFAVSHLVHAAAIVLLLHWDAALFWTLTNPVNLATGGLAYAFILAMAATSFDRTAAWLGPRRWRVLHRLGVWYIWVSFLVAFGKRIPENGPAYWLPVVALIAALALRLAAARRRRPGHQPA
jgi:DMSO/TMAO reductase YedYZ heme-binding membrane subunit